MFCPFTTYIELPLNQSYISAYNYTDGKIVAVFSNDNIKCVVGHVLDSKYIENTISLYLKLLDNKIINFTDKFINSFNETVYIFKYNNLNFTFNIIGLIGYIDCYQHKE